VRRNSAKALAKVTPGASAPANAMQARHEGCGLRAQRTRPRRLQRFLWVAAHRWRLHHRRDPLISRMLISRRSQIARYRRIHWSLHPMCEARRLRKYEVNRITKATTATLSAIVGGVMIDGAPAAMPGQATDTGAIVIQIHGDPGKARYLACRVGYSRTPRALLDRLERATHIGGGTTCRFTAGSSQPKPSAHSG
jgi:hypothetical protein